jgi:hypothetical protein
MFLRNNHIVVAGLALLKLVCILLVLSVTAGSAFAEPPVSGSVITASTVTARGELIWPEVKNNAVSAGERLQFRIRWGFLRVGEAVMEVSNIENYNNRKAYHIVVTAKSYPFFDSFYKVRNRDETWIDTESMCSLKCQKHQREGGYKKSGFTVFDHVNRKFFFSETDDSGNIKTKEGEIPSFVQDSLSALYRIRTYDLEVGKEYYLDTFSHDKTYPLKICVYRKEKIKVPAGVFKCYLVEPFLAEDAGLFKAKGRLWIWLTADERKMPVLMKSKIFVGSITAELIKH